MFFENTAIFKLKVLLVFSVVVFVLFAIHFHANYIGHFSVAPRMCFSKSSDGCAVGSEFRFDAYAPANVK